MEEEHEHHPTHLTHAVLPPDEPELSVFATDAHDEATRKRLYEDEDEEAKKRRRKNTPPPKKLNEDQWAEMFARLVKYKEIHGDCLVPKRYQEDPKLGTWVETQRVQYKKLQQTGEAVTPNNRLNAERLEKLESVGFAWSAKNIRKAKVPTTPTSQKNKRPMLDAVSRAQSRQRMQDQTWNEYYLRLAAYKEKYGDCLVPKKFEEDAKLASWVENQRVLYNRDYKPRSSLSSTVAAPAQPKMEAPEPNSIEAKSPEEWAVEMSGATEEDAAEVAATMAEATMEVVNDVVDDAAIAEMAAVAAAANDAAGAAAAVPEDPTKGKKLSLERKGKLDALGFVWSLRSKRVDDHWDLMFRQLEEYKSAHGDCLVPSRYEENYKLGKWVETQRYEYTKLQRAAESLDKGEDGEDAPDKSKATNPRLTAERRARLEAIGFEWKVKHKMKRYYDRQWDNMFEKLLKYKEEHGHCLVPKRYPPDVKLGTWVHTQRIQYRKMLAGTVKKDAGEAGVCSIEDSEDACNGEVVVEEQPAVLPTKTEEKSAEEQFFRLTDERRRRLEEAGFVWSARDSEKSTEPSRITRNSYDDQWDAMFLRLQAYKEKNGDCLVPKRCKEDPKLGTWVDTQRVQYKKMRKKLEKEGIEYVPPSLNDNQGAPTAEEDAAVRKPIVGRLTDDRIRRLESLGFVWSLRDDWQKHYEELIEYKKEHSHCNVPARYSKNRRLGIWVSAQRQQYKQLHAAPNPDSNKPRRSAPLTQERINLLNALGFTWTIRSRDSLGESWNQRLEELKAYKAQFGSCLVPSRYPPNPELGIWVGTQRTQYRLYQQAKSSGNRMLHSTAMNEDRINQLEELGFVWALRSGPDNAFRKHIAELADFRATHGHCAVPGNYKGNPKLGDWAVVMREVHKLRSEGKPTILNDEQIAELDALGFGWIEPPPDVADATNNEVTTIAPQDDEEEALGSAAEAVAVQMSFADNAVDHVPPLPPDTGSPVPAVPDAATAEHLIREAIEHAEI